MFKYRIVWKLDNGKLIADYVKADDMDMAHANANEYSKPRFAQRHPVLIEVKKW